MIMSIYKLCTHNYFSKINHFFIVLLCISGILTLSISAFIPNEYTQLEKVAGIAALGSNTDKEITKIGTLDGDIYLENDNHGKKQYSFVIINEDGQKEVIKKPEYEVVIDAAPFVEENTVLKVKTKIKYTTTNIWFYIPTEIEREIIIIG